MKKTQCDCTPRRKDFRIVFLSGLLFLSINGQLIIFNYWFDEKITWKIISCQWMQHISKYIDIFCYWNDTKYKHLNNIINVNNNILDYQLNSINIASRNGDDGSTFFYILQLLYIVCRNFKRSSNRFDK